MAIRRSTMPACEIPKFRELNEYNIMTQCEIFTAEKSFRFRFSMWGFRMNSLVAILEEATNHDPMKNLEPDRVKILAWNNQTLSSCYAKLAILFMKYRIFVFHWKYWKSFLSSRHLHLKRGFLPSCICNNSAIWIVFSDKFLRRQKYCVFYSRNNILKQW